MVKNRWGNTVRLVLVAALLAFSALSSSAAPNAGNFEISPFAGGGGFDGDRDLEVSPAVGAHVGYWLTDALSVEATLDYLAAETKETKRTVDVTYVHGDLLYNFTGLGLGGFVPFVEVGAGLSWFNYPGPGSDRGPMLDAGIGARYFFADNVALRTDLRMPVTYHATETHWLATLGISFFFGGSSETPVAKPEPAPAQAPAPMVKPEPAPAPMAKPEPAPVPAPAPAPMAKPEPEPAPAPAPVVEPAPMAKSEPEPAPAPAPVVEPAPAPAPAPVVEPAPMAAPAPAPKPAPVDTDKDGVYDDVDKCPGTPKGAIVDVKGCSVRSVTIMLNIQFDTGKSIVKPKYEAELHSFADFLKKHPEAKTQITGHTDNVGSAALNKKLSLARAQAVKNTLVEKFGIAASRVTTVGYGAERPFVDNTTVEGRALNRRIEATVTSQIVE